MINIPDSVLPIRYTGLAAAVLGLLLCSFAFVGFGVWGSMSLVFLFLVGVGIYDLRQPKRSILRNYPIIGHMRFLLEFIRPEIRQYFIESDNDATPFSRAQRSLVYQRAKGEPDKRPFGTQLDVQAEGTNGSTTLWFPPRCRPTISESGLVANQASPSPAWGLAHSLTRPASSISRP